MTGDWLNIAAVLTSPIIAVAVTLLWQHRKEVRDRKDRLFGVLMAHRRLSPPSREYVDALNLIDVVFAKDEEVLRLWHEYYDMLGSPNYATEFQKRAHKYLELLTAMAKVLGYKRLQQTDIDKFYSPQSHHDASQLTGEIQAQLLRVLKETRHVVVPHSPDAGPPASIESSADPSEGKALPPSSGAT